MTRQKTEVEEAVQASAYTETEINANYIKAEPGLIELVKCKPGLSVKERIVVEGWRDIDKQQCAHASPMPATVGSMSVAAGSMNPPNMLNIKAELGDTYIVPTVLQHMNIHYSTSQPYMSVDTDPLLCSTVKDKTIDDQFRADSHHSIEVMRPEKRAYSLLYSCNKCRKICKTKRSLLKHCNEVHGAESHKCVKCGKEYKCKAYLRKHVARIHSKRSLPTLYTCDYCLKTSGTKGRLKLHIEGVHGKPSHTCTECKKNFKCRQYLLRHIFLTHGNEVHNCPFCRKTFKAKLYLRNHNMRVHIERPAKRPQSIFNDSTTNFHSKLSGEQREKRSTCSRPTADRMSAVAGTSSQPHNVVVLKKEPADEEVELGPVVFQHVDFHYRPFKDAL